MVLAAGDSQEVTGRMSGAEYSGLWAMLDEGRLSAHVALLQSRGNSQDTRSETIVVGRREAGNIAVINVVGVMTKYGNPWYGEVSTLRIQRAVRAASADPDVSAILLRIESPGGTSAGTQELADVVAAAAKKKPVVAYIDDLGASAAYWVASQATTILANETSLVGSIGTYAVIGDWSKFFENAGVRVHVVRAGEFKGVGTIGTEITDEHLEDFQQRVNSVNEVFLRSVSVGRKMKMDRVRELADGRAHTGPAALQLGLIDGIKTFDEALSDLTKQVAKQPKGARSEDVSKEQETKPTETQQAETPKTPQPATAAELKAAFPNASAEFRLEQLEAGSTMDQAKSAYITHLESKQAEQPTQQANHGVKPVGTQGSHTKSGDTPDAIEEFSELTAKKMAAGMSRMEASIAIARDNPDLHKSYVAATNQRRGK